MGAHLCDLVKGFSKECSFVPYRQSKENTLIPQEVIHSMKKKRGKSGWMTIKIDLEKAYDRLKWESI